MSHPGLPDMTPSQLSSAGLSRTPAPRRKKATKDQQITALQDELRSIRELLSKVSCVTLSISISTLTNPFILQKHSDSRAAHREQTQDAGGDTDPETDVEPEVQITAVGMKRKTSDGTAGTTSRYASMLSLCSFHSDGALQVEAVQSYGPI